MRDVIELRPKETGIYVSKPGFRRMHQLVGHAGVCRRLDCWGVHIKNKTGFVSLDAFAASQPSLQDLQEMVDEIMHIYIATHRLQRMRNKPEKEWDLQHENALLLNKYFLLYEELSYAMNHSDIGHVETCIVSWIPILKAIGKHKYASHMTNFLLNMHFVYPSGLKCAICYYILVNPTGQQMKWRAVDWCVELNNLFTKVKNRGKGSNRSIDQIILESPLMQVYKNVQGIVQKIFDLTHLTTNHAATDMSKMFAKLRDKLSLT
ncbi:hypothetical protein PAXINDRAFT_157655 [Paxillus involutus ATCC 200175]|uniref:DUF6589 domain-containing protein n=1 Tax=Paxillus involutus ATCC 200175 TaxID=664439 RepID=A0A0C9SRC3_PAXIN|nr:hypothetical protein PAXINDRAFT_157655 [Paxillus involutus ATCC 200175]